MIWNDEFDTGVIAPAKWAPEVNCFGGGNNETQCYTARRENAFVDNDGKLHLVAREEIYSGPAVGDDDPGYDSKDTSAARSYTSGRIRTRGLFDFKYGRVEVRALLPAGQGMWPAIWMMPADDVYGGWPSSGEIDIMEAFNPGIDGADNKVSGATQYGLKWPQWSSIIAEHKTEQNPTGEFHTYMIEWEADEIRWFVDGVHFQTQRSTGWYNYIWSSQQDGFVVANPRAPFDQDFYLILNLAVGGHAVGMPDTGWDADREFVIDYVRVYQCDSGNADGTGCASAVDAKIDASIKPFPDKGAPTVSAFPIFDDGPVTLSLKTMEGKLENRLTVDSQAETPGNVVVDTPDIGGDHGQVLDIKFTGPGSVSLRSEDMSAVDGIDSAFALNEPVAWRNHGTLEFDLYVEGIDPGTSLLVGLDNGYTDSARIPIERLDVGQWNHVAIRISDLIADPAGDGSAIDLDRISSLLVLEAGGSARAHLQLDRVTLFCVTNDFAYAWQDGQYCAIDPVRTIESVTSTTSIFAEDVTWWRIDECCAGGSGGEIVADDSDDSGRGNVIQFSYTTDETVGFLTSGAPMNFSALAGGTIEFDLLVIRNPDKPAIQDPWMMQVTCIHPCGSGDVPLTASVEGLAPRVGVWQHFTFNIDDLVERGLKLTKVDAPLVIYPRWGNQRGAVFRIDNVIVKAPAQAQ